MLILISPLQSMIVWQIVAQEVEVGVVHEL